MRTRIHPKTKDRFRKAIQSVIKGLGRNVLVYKQPVKTECPNCFYDKMTGTSSGKCRHEDIIEANEAQALWVAQDPTRNTGVIRHKWFKHGRCPICKGQGYLEIKRKRWVHCLVIWNPDSRFSNDITYTAAGTEGSTIVQLKTDPAYYDVFKNCSRIVVDGIECKLSKPPILRGLGNQSVLIIVAFTTEKPKIDSGEIIKEYT